MAEITTVVCDECGAQKREVNHWYVAFRLYESVTVAPIDGGRDQRGAKPYHLCGQSCVHSILDRFMATGGLEK